MSSAFDARLETVQASLDRDPENALGDLVDLYADALAESDDHALVDGLELTLVDRASSSLLRLLENRLGTLRGTASEARFSSLVHGIRSELTRRS